MLLQLWPRSELFEKTNHRCVSEAGHSLSDGHFYKSAICMYLLGEPLRWSNDRTVWVKIFLRTILEFKYIGCDKNKHFYNFRII